MADILTYWGIYPDVINDVVERCEDALSKAGYTLSEIDSWHESVKSNTVLDNENITNSILQQYLHEAVEMLNDKGYEADYYVNCSDTHLYINNEEFYEGDDLPELGEEKIIKELKKMSEINKGWVNYGDVDFLDEGGVLIKDYYDEDRQKSLYEAVLIVPFPDDGRKVYAGHMVLDVADYKDDPTVIDFIQDYKDDGIDVVEDKEIAVAIVDALGLVELGMIAFNEYGGQAHYAMSYDAYAVDKADLVPQLSALGIHIDPQRLEELNEEIAYQKYKEEWIKEHISDTEMAATQAAYENDEESKFMTFEEYVEEYGFANGMIYASFDEFLDEEYEEYEDEEDEEYEFDIKEVYQNLKDSPEKTKKKEITDD